MIGDFAKPRYKIENLGMSSLISIPARKNWITLIFLGVWLTGWACGELFALGVLFSSVGGLLADIFGFSLDFIEFDGGWQGGTFAGVFLLVWLTIWTFAGYGALRSFLWQVAGKELIEVSRTEIRLSRPIFGLSRVKAYQANEIVDVRLLAGDERSAKKNLAGVNQLGFDYEFDIIEFGAGLTPSEAQDIFGEITTRYRQYAPAA